MSVSKSATRQSVARLEERFGIRLLDRTTRSLNLTAEGQVYYQSCLKVLLELSAAETLLASRTRMVSGTLQINLPISFGRQCIMPVLNEVTDRNPELNFDISFTDRQVDLVRKASTSWCGLAIRAIMPA